MRARVIGPGRRAAALLVTAVVLAGAALGFLLLTVTAGAAGDRARAQTAADAAALAGALDDRAAAVAIARRNGARVVAYRDVGGQVRVDVVHGDAAATATASVEWQWVPDG